MILKKELLTKSLKKGRTTAIGTLNQLSRAAGLPEPVYNYEAGGSTKKPSHFFKVRFRVPQFLLNDDIYSGSNFTLTGAGRCRSKQFAKSLAALEAMHELEEHLELNRGSLPKLLDDYLQRQKDATACLEALPIAEAISDISWKAVPIDAALSAAVPASREGRISFLRHVNNCPKALLVAKAMTLACEGELPDVTMHANQTDEGITQRFANIRSKTDIVKDATGVIGECSFGADYYTTVRLALQSIYVNTMSIHSGVLRGWIKDSIKLKKRKIGHNKRYRGNTTKKPPESSTTFQDLLDAIPYESACQNIKNGKTRFLLDALMKQPGSSFGMAKLFVKWPKHQFSAMEEVIEKIKPSAEFREAKHPKRNPLPTRSIHRGLARYRNYHETRLKERVKIFRHHQAKTPLPIDDIEKRIPHDADVTILCGGTGSGKTTRYPLMVSLFSRSPTRPLATTKVADREDDGTSVTAWGRMHTVVAQPRRLACQAAAKRVALEQGYNLGQNHSRSSSSGRNPLSSSTLCPIGYSIRFDSKPSNPEEDRTIDFQTVGVVLATAASDPLLSHVTHLCIDEVHERNADMDLLLALAKNIQQQRKQHPTLPPLKIILMSATLDSSKWEDYFVSSAEDAEYINVARVSVPDTTRFPIDIVHYGDKNFPRVSSTDQPKQNQRMSDDQLWKATSQLAMSVINQGKLQDGSILCFLPGMEEIQTVQSMLLQALKKSQVPKKPKILILHSSVSSSRQARIYDSGPKCILSTNIAETSVTIPDVKFVIDPGRERQSTMLDDSSLSENATVVGSQLVTVDIAQSAAKQRAGRAGRVAPGTCYRLYSKDCHASLPSYVKPEMLRMDLAQLVLYSISLCDQKSGDALGLISGAPDPPPDYKLQQAVSSLVEQGLVALQDNVPIPQLTHLGKAVNDIPASPRIGRMLMLGLALRSVEPALTFAALLSVPKVFETTNRYSREHSPPPESCSDVIEQVNKFQKYLEMDEEGKRNHPGGKEYAQVSKVRRQLAKTLGDIIVSEDGECNPLSCWNENGDRVGAQVALICAVTQHIACLADGKGAFATRDCAGTAKIHPSSVNFSNDRRAHWYVYDKLRKTSSPYLHVTTAASPLEIALFSNGGTRSKLDEDTEVLQSMLNWTHLADQWIPVRVTKKERAAFWRLKEILNHDMLNEVSRNSSSFRENEDFKTLIFFVMSAVEQQRREL